MNQVVSTIKKVCIFINCTTKKHIIILMLLQLTGAIITPFLSIQYQAITNNAINICNYNYEPFLLSLFLYIVLEISIEIIGNVDAIIRQDFHFELLNSVNTWIFMIEKKSH